MTSGDRGGCGRRGGGRGWFPEGGAGGHDVVEDEAAFIHFGEEVGAEALVGEEDAEDEKAAGGGEPEGFGEGGSGERARGSAGRAP